MPDPGLPTPLVRHSRRLTRKLGRGPVGALRNALLARSAAVGPPRRMVLCCDGRVYTSEQLLAPIHRHAGTLARKYGIAVQDVPLQRLMAEGPSAVGGAAILGLMLPFDMVPQDADRIASRIVAPLRAVGTKVVLFDGDDDLGILWAGVLANSDLCVKKHVFARREDYQQRMIGKSNLTDHVARSFGWSFDDNIIPASGGHAPDAIARISTGWNIALDDKIVDLARDMPPPRPEGRSIDILCRASVGPDIWTHPLRNGAVRAIEALADRFVVHAPTDRVSQGAYYREMLQSRMSLSPFGFGEICWRDFETMLCGSLLIKPDMGHVETAPDLFVSGETYVPVAWDYSDLADVVARYRQDHAARNRVVEEARRRLLHAMSPDWFLDRFEGQVLRPLGLASG